jgi:hypothetical protein
MHFGNTGAFLYPFALPYPFATVYACFRRPRRRLGDRRRNKGVSASSKSEKIVSRVSGCTLDASAEYLYFIQDHAKLCMMNVENGISKIHTLSEDADSYAVTGNRKRVYYTNDSSLYSTSGLKSAESQLITSDFTGYNLVVGASNTLYFLQGSDVYACKNGKHATLIIQNASSLYNSSNNIVYIIGEDNVYIASTKKQPDKIL